MNFWSRRRASRGPERPSLRPKPLQPSLSPSPPDSSGAVEERRAGACPRAYLQRDLQTRSKPWQRHSLFGSVAAAIQTKARSEHSLAAHFTKQRAKHCAGRLNESARSGHWTLVLFVHTAVSRFLGVPSFMGPKSN